MSTFLKDRIEPFFDVVINVANVAQLTTFRAESAKNVKDILWYADAHRHLRNRVTKHLRHSLSFLLNLLPEHRSNSITNSIGLYANNAHQTQHRAKKEENGKTVQADCILPYGSAHVVHQHLRQEALKKKWLLGLCERNLPQITLGDLAVP